jgi:hypothetical protein
VHVSTQLKSFCIFQYLCTITTAIPGRVIFVKPNTQFGQKKLAEVVSCVQEQYKPRFFGLGNYNKDIEARLSHLDRTVQDELYKLIRYRNENFSSMFPRGEYKIVVLLEVPGGEMTDAGTGVQCNKLRQKKVSHVEYRVILRGSLCP